MNNKEIIEEVFKNSIKERPLLKQMSVVDEWKWIITKTLAKKDAEYLAFLKSCKDIFKSNLAEREIIEKLYNYIDDEISRLGVLE